MVPTDPGKFIEIDIYAKDKSATVSWKLESEECSGVVVNYTVFYRATEGPLLSKTTTDRSLQNGLSSITLHLCFFFSGAFLLDVTVDHTEPKIILTDLNPETEYSVYVEAIALTGTTKSRETSFNTKKFGKKFVSATKLKWFFNTKTIDYKN